MKEIKFLLKQMAKFEPFMFVLIALYSIFIGIRPFIWIISPAYILKNTDKPFSFFLIFFIVVLLISSLIGFFESFIMNNYRMRMNAIRYRFIRMVTDYSLHLDFDKQKDKDYIEKINNANKACRDPFNGAGGIMMELPPLMSVIVSITGFAWIFFAMGLKIFLIVLAISLIMFWINYKTTKLYRDYWSSQSNNWNIFAKLNYQLRNPESKQDILIFDFISLFKSYYMGRNKERIDGLAEVNYKEIKLISLAKLISILRDGLMIYWLLSSIIRGAIDIGDFYMFFTAIFSFINFEEEILWTFSSFRNSAASFRYFLKLFEDEEDGLEEKKLPLPAKMDDFKIEFKNVSFGYPNTDALVLKDINLTINKGESLALVGENGAGKSTLALLLCGLYEPTSGQILLNGLDIRTYGKNYLDLVGAIFQDSLLMPFTIQENITFKSKETDLTDIYRKTRLDEIVESYEDKDKQVLLRTLDENGVDLSGGQKQRIFLSRALYKDESKLLILDEPTAQLDALAEKDLYMLYDKLTRDKASIFISHRLASTKFCDRVIFLKNGEITGNNTHERLIEENEEYRELYNLQAKNYKEVL